MKTTLFIAFILPKSIQQQLQRLCFGLPDVSWTEEHDFFLTVLPIGPNVNSLDLDVHEKLAKVSISPFSISLHGINCFKSKSDYSILFAEVKESSEMNSLRKLIGDELKDVPLEKGGEMLSPHVTLGRFLNRKIDPRRLGEYLENHAGFVSSVFVVDHVALIECRVSKDGTYIYEEIARYKEIRAPRSPRFS